MAVPTQKPRETCVTRERAPAPRRRWAWRAARGAAVLALAVEGLWYGIHHVPGFGPAVADGVRAVVGPAPVAWAEDVAYGLADRLNQLRYRNAPPKTLWQAPPESAPAGGPVVPARAAREPSARAPERFEPPFPEAAATGDGVWIPIPDAVAPDDAPALWKTAVHPDPRRMFAVVAIVAVDLERVALRLVAGTNEPESPRVPAERRPGLVPADHAAELVAAFNGGFKAMHGNYGMMIDGATFLPPRNRRACTVALYRDGTVAIGRWPALRDGAPRMAAYRQTPPCLVDDGALHAELSESNRIWGSTVSGDTIIRRSAIGVDASGKTLFYGLGEAVTSQAIARAMAAAGASDAAQLDVNHAYPRFLLYEKGAPGEPPRAASSLIPDVQFEPDEYVVEPAPRDFFYLMRRRSTS